MQIKAAPLVNPPNRTTTDREEDQVPVRSLESGNCPSPPDSASVEGLAHAASATNSDTNRTPNMATTISQFMEEKSAIPSFDRVETISENLVPLGTTRDRQTWTVRFFLWLQDQKTLAGVSAESTRGDSGEAHENPWKPCQPSEDAKEWNGVEELDGAPPGVEFDCPATPPVDDGIAVTDVGRTE